MKRRSLWTALLAIALAAVVVLGLAACGEENKLPEKKDPVSKYTAKGEWTEIADKLSWEDINAFPIKSSDMSIEEARQLCVDFFRYTKTACWIPDDNFSYFHMAKHQEENNYTLNQIGGQVYGGLPYIFVSSGNIYRLMDFMDEETGVVDISEMTINPHLYGNQCSIGAYWGWARVINSAKYDWTQNMVVSNGFIRVGDYTYPDYINTLSDTYRTTHILEENGREKMYECYALLKAGDGIVYYTTAGHVVMISQDAEVIRDAEGKIDPTQSYVLVIDQTPTWATATNEAGDTYSYECNVDAKWTFQKLFDGNYMPFTYAEWLGTDPIEDTEITFSHTGDTITVDQLYNSKVTSNYGLADIYAMIYDAAGNEVFKTVSRATEAGVMEIKFLKTPGSTYTWGNLEDLDPKQEYTLKVVAQVGTGERPTLWEGKFIQE